MQNKTLRLNFYGSTSSNKLQNNFEFIKIKENKLPKNIVVSKSDINRDFKKSKFILYRGSASVLNAVMNKIFLFIIKIMKVMILTHYLNILKKVTM